MIGSPIWVVLAVCRSFHFLIQTGKYKASRTSASHLVFLSFSLTRLSDSRTHEHRANMVTLLSLPAELRVYILRLGGTVGFCQCEKCSRVSLADGLSSDDCECGSPAGVEDAYISTATMWFWVNRSTSLPASLRQSTWCWNASGSTLEWRKQKASVVSTVWSNRTCLLNTC